MARGLPAGHVLTLLVGLALQGLSPSLGHNIDTSNAAVFFSNASKQFGYQVLQLGEGSETSIIVGAPGELNSTGKVYQCKMRSGKCEAVPVEEDGGVSHFGMTLASDTQGSTMIACGPGHQQFCDGNLYMSGMCYLFDAILNVRKNITTGYQKCLKGNTDLVFLFDGSVSMKADDFNTIKEFMIDVMEKLHNTSIHFAAVQFSFNTKLEFDFNNYTHDPNPQKLLANVRHEKSITNTFKAVKYVVDEVFTPKRGTRKGANKVIIIITDGDASDTDEGSIEAAKKKGIVRLIIGIGHLLNTTDSQKNLRMLASEPKDQFLRVLASFEQLKGSFNDLQSKIYAIEGGENGNRDSGSFHLEMSSSGFSADLSQGRVVLGAVGADNWAGGVLEQRMDFTGERFITTPLFRKEMEGAYLGYALKFLQHQQREFYAVGAPRYLHVGRVLIFEVNTTTANWTLKQEIEGKQTGSYFGGVLCAVDLDNDQESDLLLVGAPLHFTETNGGCVYVYGWEQDNLVLRGKLHGVSGYPLGRFGAAIADLADISGDGWTDVAVGAPLEEEEEEGAVYIYNSHEGGLQTHYSQRIKGASLSPNLKFFGQAIHGKRDLDGDGLIDITVGALGEVRVVRSRPIVTVDAQVTFEPTEIRVEDVECSGDPRSWHNKVLSLNVCFVSSLATKSYNGPLSASLLFSLEIDGNRMKNRGVLSNGKKVIDGTKDISLGKECLQERINITNCIEDYLSPIKVLVNYSLRDDNEPSKGHPRPVLNPLKNRTMVEIPFGKNCGTDDVCQADMQISFHDSGSKVLVVSPQHQLEVNLELRNHQEDAYFVTLHVPHIPGLSFRKASVVKSNALVIVNCDGMLHGQDSKGLTCNISHPVYRNSTKALIQLRFGSSAKNDWKYNLDMEAHVSSNNEMNGTLNDNTANISIPVQYPISLVVEGLEASMHYVNFTSQGEQNKTVKHVYKVTNMPMGTSQTPEVTVFVQVPTTFTGRLTWNVDNIETVPSVTCQALQTEDNTRSHSKLTEQCTADQYSIFRCDLGLINSSEIHVTGTMYPNGKIERSSRYKYCTALWLTFNTRRFINIHGTEFSQFQVTEVEEVYEMDYLPIIIGSAVGGLFLLILIIVGLYKCGFFKRNYKQKMDFPEVNVNALPSEDNLGDDTEKEAKSEGSEEGDKEKEAKCFTDLTDGETEPK
ncbi:integrin alpha-L [Elgaria multicarinata webbii]|uniref:integrin alpha-L n=1 Tax=Elgaria multicarinata webbii TaxID=159646 RepID=UPI002FCD57AE